MTPACSRRSSNIVPTDAPAPKIGIEVTELRDLIQQSDRPYVLLNFFATWCKPCRTELPDFVALQNDAASQIKVLLVSIDNAQDAKTKLKDFLGELGVNFQTYSRPVAEAGLIKQFYPSWDGYIPLSLVYDKQGQLLEAITGLTDRSEIELIVNRHKQLGS